MTRMAEEIAQSGTVVARLLADDALVRAAAAARARDPAVVVTVARGSSDHAALYLKYLLEISLGIPCASMGPSLASLYRAPLRLAQAVAVSISQSGRSPDIVEMQRAAKAAGALTLALVNDVASPLAADPHALAPLHAGEEVSVAATKSMIAALTGCARLVAEWGADDAMRDALKQLPAALDAQTAPPPQALVERVAAAPGAFVLGRGATYALAAEAALKLKETCGLHAEAFSAAEVLHGPAEIVRPGFLVLAFAPQDAAREGLLQTLARLQEMGAQTILIDAQGADAPDRLAAATLGHAQVTPIAMIHRFYALAEATARRLGRDPDRPRNLAKITRTR